MLASMQRWCIVGGVMTRVRHPGRYNGLPAQVREEIPASQPEGVDKTEAERAAIKIVGQFIGLDVDGLMDHELTAEEIRELQLVGSFPESNCDTPNRRLAMALMGIEEAVQVIFDARWGDQQQISDTQLANIRTTGEFSASRFGVGFGVLMKFEYPVDGRLDGDGRDLPACLAVRIPTDDFLAKIMELNRSEETYLFATESDRISPEWSVMSKGFGEEFGGGVAHRSYSADREASYTQGRAADGIEGQDVFRRDRIEYHPFSEPNGAGIRRYIEIMQELLRRFMDAAYKPKRGTQEMLALSRAPE